MVPLGCMQSPDGDGLPIEQTPLCRNIVDLASYNIGMHEGIA